MTAKDHTQLAGEGVTANVNDVQVHVGNERLMSRLGLFDALSEDHKNMVQSWASLGGTVAFLSIEGAGIVCAFCVADAIRPEAASVMDSLHRLGIETIMLTGDNHDAALAIGEQVGLGPEEIRSELLPEDKLTIVSEMKQDVPHSSICANPFRPHGLVLMCGDGVNDGPALAISNVGVAMGAGAALAMETADVTLLDSQLDKLVYSICMGKKVIRKIFENMTFSIVVKAVVAGFAFAGYAQLWAAIACDVGAMLIVTLNGMTLLSRRKKSVELLEAKAVGV
jgi:Cd2+/Zn2+-exporting ATPase